MQCMLMRMPFPIPEHGTGDAFGHVNFLLEVRASAGIVPRSLVGSQPPCQSRPIFLSTVYAKLHNQFSPGSPLYVQHSNSGPGLSVERFEPRERARSCINDGRIAQRS